MAQSQAISAVVGIAGMSFVVRKPFCARPGQKRRHTRLVAEIHPMINLSRLRAVIAALSDCLDYFEIIDYSPIVIRWIKVLPIALVLGVASRGGLQLVACLGRQRIEKGKPLRILFN